MNLSHSPVKYDSIGTASAFKLLNIPTQINRKINQQVLQLTFKLERHDNDSTNIMVFYGLRTKPLTSF